MSRDRARHLRRNMTDAERFAWARLRYRQLGGHKFRRQVPIGPYVADFVCRARRLILELDGGQHAESVAQDRSRTQWLEGQRFRVLRFWDCDVLTDWDTVELVIWEHLEWEAPTPHPSPPPQGGRGPEALPPPSAPAARQPDTPHPNPPPQGGREQE